MAIKAIYESEDEVPEAMRSEYKKVTFKGPDGKDKDIWALDIEAYDSHPAVRNLKAAHDRVKSDKQVLATDLTALKARLEGLPDDFEPAEFQRIKDELETLKSEHDDPKKKDEVQRVRAMLEQRITDLTTRHTQALAEKDNVIRDKENVITHLIADEGLTKALAEVGVQGPLLKAAKSMLRGSVEVVKDEDGAYKGVVKTDMDPDGCEIGKFVNDWSNSDEGKVFVTKPKGGDANGSDERRLEGNPWSAKNLNMTEQGRIVIADKGKAERLMRAAGVAETKINQVLGRSAA